MKYLTPAVPIGSCPESRLFDLRWFLTGSGAHCSLSEACKNFDNYNNQVSFKIPYLKKVEFLSIRQITRLESDGSCPGAPKRAPPHYPPKLNAIFISLIYISIVSKNNVSESAPNDISNYAINLIKQSAMARLKDIPNEILTSIFAHLSDINHSSIFDVTLVNKHFNQLASPLRVRHWSDEGYYGYYDGDSPCPPISRLALELLRHPEYRLQVRTLSFSYFQRRGDRDAARIPMKPENLQMLAWAAEEVVPTLAESTYICVRILEENDDAIAVLVLAWATNLRNLSITIPFFDPAPVYDEGPLVLRFAKQLALRFDSKDLKPSAPLPLAKLRELEFRHDNIESIVGLKYLTPFLYLPNLKNLKTYRLGDQEYTDTEESVQNYIRDKYCMPFPNGTSSIESITIKESTLSSDGLSELLGSCRGLRHFYLHFSFDLEENKRNWTILAKSLVKHEESLEDLDLCVDNCDVEWVGDTVDDGAGDPKPIDFTDCYHHLTGLRTLRVPMPQLSGYDLWKHSGSPKASHVRLPESIQHLKLLDINLWSNARRLSEHEISPFLDFVLNLIKETGPEGHLTNLQTLDCSKALWDDPMRKKIQEIKDLAEERGVNILLHS